MLWQYFSGMEYYQGKFPCDPAQITRFRQMLGEAGVEGLLKATIDTAVKIKTIRLSEFERVIVDSTVVEKAVAYPTDSRLLVIARYQLTKNAKHVGIKFKQTFAMEGKQLRRKARLCPCQAVQTSEAYVETPTNYCGHCDSGITAQAQGPVSGKLSSTGENEHVA